MACSSDFPNEPDQAVILEAVDWPSELHVTDVDTIEIRVRLRDSPQTITGLRVRWQSDNDEILQIDQLQPAEGGDLEDTLVAQRQAKVTARSGGADTIRVVVEARGDFEPAESAYVLRVTQRWTSVSAGRAHSCGITVDASAYCWGDGEDGKLGRGRPLRSDIPVRVIATDNLRFDSVSTGDRSSCGLTTVGLAYCWGSGSEGRLGNGDAFERGQLLPVRVTGPAFRMLYVDRVACGVTDDLTALCWGGNGEGQLGFNPLTIPGLNPCLEGLLCSLIPIDVDSVGLPPDSYFSLSVGGHHTCGVSRSPQSGSIFCWGIGLHGALGSATQSSPIPIRVASGETFTAVSAGGEHTCALTSSKRTYCWGANADGQLGNGTTDDASTPVLVSGETFVSIAAGGRHTCGIAESGEAFCWGSGSSGQLGSDSVDRRPVPFPVKDAPRFESLSAGDVHTCGVAAGGALYCWGAMGRLGIGSEEGRAAPTRVSEPE